MSGKATFIKVNQLRYGSLSQKYQGTSVQVLIAFNGIVFLLVKLSSFSYLKSITWNTYSKSQLLGIHISFRMFQAMDGKIGKLIVAHQFWVDWWSKLYNSKWLKYCVMILLVARRRVIIMITSEADNDKRLTWVLNRWELVLTISFIVLSCTNVKLSFLFVALYLALNAQY